MQIVSIRKFLFKKHILGKFFFLTSWKECHLKEYRSSPFLRVSKFMIHFLQTTAREKFNLQKKNEHKIFNYFIEIKITINVRFIVLTILMPSLS